MSIATTVRRRKAVMRRRMVRVRDTLMKEGKNTEKMSMQALRGAMFGVSEVSIA
jgi:hypothetical protein